jgi:hypothetical protein
MEMPVSATKPKRRRKPVPAQVQERIRLIGRALELPEAEVEAACADENEMLDFVRKYNQSLDWVWAGGMASIIRGRLATRLAQAA